MEKPEKKTPVLDNPLLEFPVQDIPKEENMDIHNKK